MKAIMISTRPEWVFKILDKEKTLEVRTTCPKEWKDYLSGKTKIKPQPMKGYIYCTKGKKLYKCVSNFDKDLLNGKVVAEFQCNEIEVIKSIREKRNGASYQYHKLDYIILKQSCLTEEQILNYTNGNDLYGWHIDNLKIYDKPKELIEFSHYIPNNDCPKKQCGINCEDCMSYDDEHETCLELWHLHREIKRPPQSWCYVEELEEV